MRQCLLLLLALFAAPASAQTFTGSDLSIEVTGVFPRADGTVRVILELTNTGSVVKGLALNESSTVIHDDTGSVWQTAGGTGPIFKSDCWQWNEVAPKQTLTFNVDLATKERERGKKGNLTLALGICTEKQWLRARFPGLALTK